MNKILAKNGAIARKAYKLADNVVVSLFSGFFLACTAELLISGASPFSASAVGKMEPIRILLFFTVLSVGLFLLFRFKRLVYREVTVVSVLLYGIAGTTVSFDFYFTLAILAAAALMLIYMREIFPDRPLKNLFASNRALFAGVAVIFLIGVTILSIGTVARYDSFTASTFDFGLFCQMFESMATDFTQNTTLERNKLLSHFAVHFSPIYYLLLPFYMIFRCPEFLLITQNLIAISAVIPFVLLCKKWRYDNFNILLAAAAFVSAPYITGGCFYDFHENAFLPPLLMWLFYFLEKENPWGVMAMSLLTLCVKEDAGMYLVCIALFVIFSKRYPVHYGAFILLLGGIGFVGATSFINSCGEGIMVSRYDLYLTEGQDSLTDVVLNVLKNPAFFISNLLDEKKLMLLCYLALPTGLLCFRARRFGDFALFLPMVIVNLSTDYPYMSEINYQYVFGSGTLLFFLFIRNLRYSPRKRKTLVFALSSSVILCLASCGSRYAYNIKYCQENRDFIDKTAAILSDLPKDASIMSTTYLTPHLYDHREVYMYPYDEDTDIVVLDNRPGRLAGYSDTLIEYMNKGYRLYKNEGFATILVNPYYNGIIGL